ncbi:hypothetical protein ACIGB6_10130 [Paeniglutamicibacter gangotriensis]|uniref:hypothetical protein n=1 Tax=Paeniglutamicibacter gangotriensis TaxID=254787 RepID=UPI0037CA7250
MTPAEAAAILTHANQLDAFLPVNDANTDAWWMALKNHEFKNAKWAVSTYYAETPVGRDGRVPSLAPRTLRDRIRSTIDTVASIDSAQKALPPARSPVTFRERNPEKWDELMAKGRDDRRAELARRGIPLTQFQTDGDKPNGFQMPA